MPIEFPFSYGSEPAAAPSGSSDRPQAVGPHDSVDITLGEESYARLREMLFRENYPLRFKQVEVTIERVLFSNGLMWYKSYFFLRDPNNPNRWVQDKPVQKGAKSGHNLKPDARADKNMRQSLGLHSVVVGRNPALAST